MRSTEKRKRESLVAQCVVAFLACQILDDYQFSYFMDEANALTHTEEADKRIRVNFIEACQ